MVKLLVRYYYHPQLIFEKNQAQEPLSQKFPNDKKHNGYQKLVGRFEGNLLLQPKSWLRELNKNRLLNFLLF